MTDTVDDQRAARRASICTAIALIVAAPVALWAARDQWFYLDEFDFVAARSLREPSSLFEHHAGHWTTIPIILYRILFRLFGLRHYTPYLIPVVLAHLAVAAQLHVVMRRSGSDPWIATAATVLFAFLGSGRDNITWGFQVTLTGSLAFGLAHLLLADHTGPPGRRDLLAGGCAVAALACSGLGIITTAVAAGAVLLRRGWRPAALHAGVPAVIYLAWATAFRGSSLRPSSTWGQRIDFVASSYVDTFEGLGGSLLVGIVLAGLVGASLLRVRHARWVRGQGATVVALALGSMVFAAATALERTGIQLLLPGAATPGRYVYVLAAMLLPVVVTGATEVARRRPTFSVRALLLLVLLAGLPSNLTSLEASGAARYTLGSRDMLVSLALASNELRPPPAVEPSPDLHPRVSNGWLREQLVNGRIISEPRPPESLIDSSRIAVSFAQVEGPSTRCEVVERGRPIQLSPGDLLHVDGWQAVVAGTSGAAHTLGFVIRPNDDVSVTAVLPITLTVRTVIPPGSTIELCRS